MKQSIGFAFSLNIIIVFILVAFAFIMGIMSYSKAYKTNSRIVNEIEKCSGFNSCSITEINRVLNNLGYESGTRDCPVMNIDNDEIRAIDHSRSGYNYCVYEVDNGGNYYNYRVRTFMSVDFPLIENFRIPINTKTNKIYNFG